MEEVENTGIFERIEGIIGFQSPFAPTSPLPHIRNRSLSSESDHAEESEQLKSLDTSTTQTGIPRIKISIPKMPTINIGGMSVAVKASASKSLQGSLVTMDKTKSKTYQIRKG